MLQVLLLIRHWFVTPRQYTFGYRFVRRTQGYIHINELITTMLQLHSLISLGCIYLHSTSKRTKLHFPPRLTFTYPSFTKHLDAFRALDWIIICVVLSMYVCVCVVRNCMRLRSNRRAVGGVGVKWGANVCATYINNSERMISRTTYVCWIA